MRPRAVLRLAHLWAGLALSLLLLTLAITGSALVYKEAYWRMVHPELRGPPPELGPPDHARAIATARALYGGRLRSVKMPEPGVPAYHLYLDGAEAFLAADGRRVIDEWRPHERATAVLFDVHAHLMAGEAGERVGGIAALLGSVLVVTGFVLWWPARRRFRVANVLPRGLAHRSLVQWHRDLGALLSPLLLVLLLTGGGIVFYGTAGRLLNGLFGDPRLGAAAPAPITRVNAGERADSVMLEDVESLLPGARLVFYYPPRDVDRRHGFRLKRPCELHPNGRSYVYLDLDGSVLQTADACAAAAGERALHAFYPLHAGKTGSALYKLLTFLGGLALAAVSASGALAYAGKLRPRPDEVWIRSRSAGSGGTSALQR